MDPSWNAQQLSEWLQQLSLNAVDAAVRKHGITARKLADMDDGALVGIGISDMRQRVSLLRAIRRSSMAPAADVYTVMKPQSSAAPGSYMPMRNSMVVNPSEEEEYTVLQDAIVPGVNGKPLIDEGEYTDMRDANVPSLADVSRGVFDGDRPPAKLPNDGFPRTNSGSGSGFGRQGSGNSTSPAATMSSLDRRSMPLLPETNASAPELMKEAPKLGGFLMKQGFNVKNWKNRFVILRKGCIYYFTNPQAARPKGCFSLAGYRVALAPDCKRGHGFTLIPLAEPGRQWLFAAQDEAQLTAWVKAIEGELAICNEAPRSRLLSTVQALGMADDESSSDDELYDEPYDDSIFKDSPAKPEPRSAPSPPTGRSADKPPVRPPSSLKPSASSSNLGATEVSDLVPDAPLEQCKWFVPRKERADIESLRVADLSFLVRQKDPSSIKVLSVFAQGKFRHYKIFQIDGVGFSLGGDSNQFFPTEVALVRHYQLNCLPRASFRLGKPFQS